MSLRRIVAVWSVVFFEVNAVNGTSATWALEIQAPVAWPRIASVYLIVVQALSWMLAIARLAAGSIRAVTETRPPAFVAAETRVVQSRCGEAQS